MHWLLKEMSVGQAKSFDAEQSLSMQQQVATKATMDFATVAMNNLSKGIRKVSSERPLRRARSDASMSGGEDQPDKKTKNKRLRVHAEGDDTAAGIPGLST